MTMSSQTSTFTLTAPDGHAIHVYHWAPEGRAKAAVQIAHGAAEHAARYARFAQFLNQHGYAVYASDHRGHGQTAGDQARFGQAGDDGWNWMVRDSRQLANRIFAEHPGEPLFLFGHSMGSLLAQQCIQEWGNDLKGVVLSGTFGDIANLEALVQMAENTAQTEGAEQPSALLGAMFSAFNQPFQPATTGFEWLSRDEAEVQKYVADPACGFGFSNGLTAGMLRGAHHIWTPEREAGIPTGLPMLMIAGEQDPAGGFGESVRALARRYEALGLTDLTVKLYPGARHEVLNETNRDEVQGDVLAWFEAHL